MSDRRGGVRPLRAGRHDVPALVLVHPASGDAAAYAPLAAHLRWPGPIVGVDAPGLDADDTWPTGAGLGGLAARYLDELDRAGAGRLPAVLVGWSVGGVIAAEMSQQRIEAGGQVAFLGLIDCRAPGPAMRGRPTDDLALARMFAATTARTRGRELVAPPDQATPGAVLRALVAVGAAPAGWSEVIVAHRLALGARLARALFSHEQRRLSARVHLFEAEAEHPLHPRPPTLGWEEHAEVVRAGVPGTHFTLLADEHAPALAAQLDDALGAASP